MHITAIIFVFEFEVEIEIVAVFFEQTFGVFVGVEML